MICDGISASLRSRRIRSACADQRLPRTEVLAFSQEILDDASVEIIWVNEDLHRRGVELLRQRQDKTYSLCDAVSFVLMRECGETEALTTDRHFEQEGLIRLLAP